MGGWPASLIFDKVAADGSSLFADAELGPVLFRPSPWILTALRRISCDYLLSDTLLGSKIMSPSHLGVVLNGFYLPSDQFTDLPSGDERSEGGHVSIPMIRGHVGNGASLVFHNAHHWHRALRQLCDTIEDSGGRQAGATLFYTPPHQHGAAPHRDGIDIFALQISGSKEWLIESVTSTVVVENTLLKEDDFTRTQPRRIRLSTGDAVYVPAGTAHTAWTLGLASVHASVWFNPVSVG